MHEDDAYWRGMRKGWNIAASEYEATFVPMFAQHYERCIAVAKLQVGERVLDVACGNGAATFLAARAVGASGSVVGVDYSHEMVAKAQAQATALRLSNTRFERHRMEKIELPDASFDAVLCIFGLMYAIPFEPAFAELHRLLRPGGRLSLAVWGRRAQCGFREVFSLVSERVGMDVCPLFFALGATGATARALEQAGFAEIHEERTMDHWHHDSGQDACRAMFLGGPPALPYSMLDESARRELDAAYLATLADYRHGDAYDVPAEVVYAQAIKPA